MKTIRQQIKLTTSSLALISFCAISQQASADFVINDDLIVDGSSCIGFDCVNGESFGFDTIRLKEHNLRIKFEDTSTAASFPSTDWQLTANASANGGASKFSIDDISGGRTPFTVEANARSHSLYVDDGGRIGNRTSTPSTEIHSIDGDTPTLRLQQDGSSGFAPQTWDMAGNETNFFIRDVSNGSTLPFRIKPGAPTSSISIDDSGDVGIGTNSPDTSLDISRSGTTAQLQFEDTSASHKWVMGQSTNNAFAIVDPDTTTEFRILTNGNLVLTNNIGTNTMTLNNAGNMIITGVLTEGSDINSKENIESVDTSSVLERILKLAISTWEYKADNENNRHLGPMAQDFYKQFSLGKDDKHIATLDTSGVALAGIQELAKQSSEKDKSIETLKSRITKLEALVTRLTSFDKQVVSKDIADLDKN